METIQQNRQNRQFDTLMSLRERALSLVEQAESEELLTEAIAILGGMPLPCAYTYEQMESSLHEAEVDYQNGRHTSHSSMCERYGV